MAEIRLKDGTVALVDDCDLWLARYTWHRDRDGYVVRSANGVHSMHREILAADPGEIVDHRNGDRADNRRVNLRRTGFRGNAANRRPMSACGFKGVAQHRNGRWQAQVKIAGRGRYLGLFDTPEAAARAYDAAARDEWGDLAWLNFPGAA